MNPQLSPQTRRQIYTLLIVLAAALIFGRIMAVSNVDTITLQRSRLSQVQARLDAKEAALRTKNVPEESMAAELEKTKRNLLRDAVFESPFLSGNDRSRWCTIRVLVEPDKRITETVVAADGTEHTKTVWYAIDKVQTLKGWDTIDMAKHSTPDEPDVEGMLEDPNRGHLYSTKPPLLPTVMALPYAVLYGASGGQISLETHPFFVVRTTIVLLHLIPLVIGWCLLARLIERFGTTDWAKIFCVAFICFGTFLSTFAVTLNNHLPAVFCVTVALYCGVRVFFDGEKRRRYFFGAGLCAAFLVVCELPGLSFFCLLGLAMLLKCPRQTLLAGVPAALIVLAGHCVTNYAAHQTVLPAYSQPQWYFYKYERGGVVRDSYWKSPVGIDRGETSRAVYAFHASFGHHGIFLLTPVWLLSFWGIALMCRGRYVPESTLSDEEITKLRWSALAILLITVVVFTFYMFVPQGNRNYGGMTSALRWMFWFAPLWNVPLVFAVDRLSVSRVGRALCLVLLAISALSAAYPTWNPWTMPWPYNLMVYLGWPVV